MKGTRKKTQKVCYSKGITLIVTQLLITYLCSITTSLESSWYNGQTRFYRNIENELLKAGYVIFYYDQILVAGSHQGD
jgi:hypothetical protein